MSLPIRNLCLLGSCPDPKLYKVSEQDNFYLVPISIVISQPFWSKNLCSSPWLLYKNGKMGLKFFYTKQGFTKFMPILENKTTAVTVELLVTQAWVRGIVSTH